MKESRWRLAARKAIQKAIAENTGKSEKEVRKAISDAYPFGERARYPYKIWLDEVQIQTSKKVKHPYRQPLRKPESADPNQAVMEWVTNSDLSREVVHKT